jgi:TolA-binding protein
MQTQDAPAEFLFKLWPWLEANRNKLIGALAAILVVMAVGYFISAQHAQREVDAGQALTMLMVSPPANSSQAADALAALASKYAGTAAGQRAQLQAGAALFNAEKYPEAQAQFQKFLDANPSGTLAATAQLGVGACLEAQNKTDLAANAYQRVVLAFKDSPSVPEADFALGRIAEQQNKLTEAMTYYQDAARAAMGGSLAQEAMIHASEMKTKIAAAAPKPAAAPAVAPKPVAMPSASPANKP